MDTPLLAESISVGPWGGQGGTEWSYKPRGKITEIVIAHGDVVDSIYFTSVDENGTKETSEKFGGKGGTTSKISINSSEEFLTLISGTRYKIANIEVVQSLCFYTNRTIYGPFGKTTGSSFEIPLKGGVIIGFHGGAGTWLDSIGFYAKPSCYVSKESIKLGPWGGQGGIAWSYKPSGAITGIVVAHGDVVDSISFIGVNENGMNENSNKFGGSGGTAKKISIAWPNEYLTSISGTRNRIAGIEVIESLSFYTNRAKYGPFGNTKGTSFDLPVEGGVIAGFYGGAGTWLDSIGFYAKRLCSCFNKESIRLGPWGGLGGTAWSYNPGGSITEIAIAAGDVVDSISFTSVDENGTKDVSKKFGGNGGTTTKISIDWPKEYLTSISGTRGTIGGIQVIQSLTFYTNKTKYGPFGKTTGSSFELPMEYGIIGGFNGSAGTWLDSIGVYAKPPCY